MLLQRGFYSLAHKMLTKSRASTKLLLPDPFDPANTENGERARIRSESMLLKFPISNVRMLFLVIALHPQGPVPTRIE